MSTDPHIMIVDDDEMNREMLRLILSRHFSNLHFAGSGEEAVEISAGSTHIDLILMDLEMPVMDGFQATHVIRSREAVQGGHIPIVALTAHGLHDTIERCTTAGIDAFIKKPFNQTEIVAIITQLVRGDNRENSLSRSESVHQQQAPSAADLADGQKEAFNLSELKSRMGDNDEYIAGYIALFIEEIEKDLPAVERAISAEDSNMVARLTHSIKGNSCNIGAERMYSVAEEADTASKNGDFSALRASVALLRAEYAEFKSATRSFASAPHLLAVEGEF